MTCHAVFFTGLSIIFLALAVVGFPVLVGIHVQQRSEDQDQQVRKEALPMSICHPSLQPSCNPDACTNATCLILPRAICIPDRCGCDAHFFLWDKKQQVYQNVTEKCIASTNPTQIKDVSTNVSSSSRGLVLRKTVQLTRLKRAADTPEAKKPKRPRKSGQDKKGKGKGGGRLRKKKQSSSKKKRNNRRRSKGRRNKERRHRGPHRKHKGKGKRPPSPEGAPPPDAELPLPEIEGPAPENDAVAPPPTEVNIQPAPVESSDPAEPSVVNVSVPASKERASEKTASAPTTVIINTDGDGAPDDGNAEAEVASEEDSSSDKTEGSPKRK